jgi:hypothetical protein
MDEIRQLAKLLDLTVECPYCNQDAAHIDTMHCHNCEENLGDHWTPKSLLLEPASVSMLRAAMRTRNFVVYIEYPYIANDEPYDHIIEVSIRKHPDASDDSPYGFAHFNKGDAKSAMQAEALATVTAALVAMRRG